MLECIINIFNAISDYLKLIPLQTILIDGGVLALIVSFIISPSKYLSRQRLYKAAEIEKNYIMNEQVLFDIGIRNVYPKNFFYGDIKIHKLKDNENVSINTLSPFSVITGRAGSGKSSVLKHLYLNCFCKPSIVNNVLCLIFGKTCYYLNSQNIVEFMSKDFQLRKDIEKAHLKKLTFFIDGIDEAISAENCESFFDVLAYLNTHVKKINLIITCRNDFTNHIRAMRNAFGTFEFYELDSWSKEQCSSFIACILNRLDIDNKTKESIKLFFNQKGFFDNLIEKDGNNPLLLKLLLYVKIKNPEYRYEENRYNMYLSFMRIIVNIQRTNKAAQATFEDVIDNYASKVYEVFYNGTSRYVPKSDEFAILLITFPDNKYSFRHETFFEFFVAHHVKRVVENNSCETIKVFSREYDNSFSDFVSEALSSKGTKLATVMASLVKIYFLTLSEENQASFKKQFKSTPWCIKNNELEDVCYSLKAYESIRFFTVKYEILFRLGRLGLNSTELKEFLKFIYYKDKQINSDKPFANEHKERYLLVALKRCCAISASLIGEESIEIDYVQRMLPFSQMYDEVYDSVNRTHTLLYYGDIPMKSNGVIDFVDTLDTIEFDCEKACLKRLKRLGDINDYKEIIRNMKPSKTKIYRFRVFDAATIYTFILNRKNNRAKLWWLDNKAKETLENYKTSFNGGSWQRKKILNEIQRETKILLHDLLD